MGMRNLSACMGSAIRVARRNGRNDVANILWQGLFKLNGHRQKIYLEAALGLDAQSNTNASATTTLPPLPAGSTFKAGDSGADGAILQSERDASSCVDYANVLKFKEAVTQTTQVLHSDEECQALVMAMVTRRLEEANMTMNNLVQHLDVLERKEKNREESASEPSLPSTFDEHRDDEDGRMFTSSFRSSAVSSSSPAPISLQELRDRHRAQRVAVMERRRQARLL